MESLCQCCSLGNAISTLSLSAAEIDACAERSAHQSYRYVAGVNVIRLSVADHSIAGRHQPCFAAALALYLIR